MDIMKGQKKPRKRDENRPKLTALEQRAIQLVKENPMLSNYQIGKKLKDLGVSANERSIYVRLKKNEYLHGEIEQIRQHHTERMLREATPAAIDVHIERLKAKPSKELWCNHNDRAVTIGNDCKFCDNQFKCKDYLNHKEKIRNHNESKKDWVKMAEAVEFKIDDSKRPGIPQTINFTEVRAIINQTINTDVEPGYFKELAHKGDED